MSERHVGKYERLEALKVFKQTIPYDKIAITGAIGLNDRAYTLPNNWAWTWQYWDVNMGNDALWKRLAAYTGRPNYYWETLIHEFTHVWQGHNKTVPWGYVANSVWHQITQGDNAYKFSLGKKWSDYNAEQQASIVEGWYARGCDTSDKAFHYIRDNIWKAKG